MIQMWRFLLPYLNEPLNPTSWLWMQVGVSLRRSQLGSIYKLRGSHVVLLFATSKHILDSNMFVILSFRGLGALWKVNGRHSTQCCCWGRQGVGRWVENIPNSINKKMIHIFYKITLFTCSQEKLITFCRNTQTFFRLLFVNLRHARSVNKT